MRSSHSNGLDASYISSESHKIAKVFVVSFIALFVSLLGSSKPAFAAKVNYAPATATISEGNVQSLAISLDEPIIAPGPDPGYVTINFSSSNTGRLTVSPSSVTYQFNEWASTKTVTVTAVEDSTHHTNGTVAVFGSVVSNAEYYNGYTSTYNITVNDNDPAPTTTTTTSPTTPTTSTQPSGQDATTTTKASTKSQSSSSTSTTVTGSSGESGASDDKSEDEANGDENNSDGSVAGGSSDQATTNKVDIASKVQIGSSANSTRTGFYWVIAAMVCAGAIVYFKKKVLA